MKKLASTLPNMVIVLTVTTLLAGLLLGYVNNATADAKAAAENEKRTNALKAVVETFDNDPMAEAIVVPLADNGINATVYPARIGQDLVGGAVEITTPKGFSGDFTIVVGLDVAGAITGYEVTQHAETPGLGAKMGEWFRDGSRNVIGKTPWEKPLAVAKDGGEIDAITAATISSRAFVDALNQAATAWQIYLESETATKE